MGLYSSPLSHMIATFTVATTGVDVHGERRKVVRDAPVLDIAGAVLVEDLGHRRPRYGQLR